MNCGLLQIVLESKGLLHVILVSVDQLQVSYGLQDCCSCRGVIGITAPYSGVSRTIEEIIQSAGQQQFVLESALLNVILKSVGLLHPVLVSVGQLNAVFVSLGPSGHSSSVSATAGRFSDASSTAACYS